MNNAKNFLYFILAFVIFYIQPVSFGPIKGSIIVQLIVFIVLGAQIIKKRPIKSDAVAKSSLWVALKVPLTTGVISTPAEVIVDFSKFLVFPLFYYYLKNFIKSALQLERVIKFFSIFVILSAIPYLLNILKPVAEGYKLTIFGDEAEKGFVGLFQNSHSAGVITSMAIVNLCFFNFIRKDMKYKNICTAIIILGVYVLYKTYVRTGYITLAIGLLVLFIRSFRMKYLFRYLLVGAGVGAATLFVFNNDETLRNRIEDKHEYSSGKAVEDVGSGRLIFQLAAYDIWTKGTFDEVLLGIGVENMTKEMLKRVHLKIHTHNGFSDALVKDGLIGLILFLAFLITIFRRILKSGNGDYKLLCFSTFGAYLVFQVVQGGIISPMIEIFLAFNLSLLNFQTETAKTNNTPVKKAVYQRNRPLRSLALKMELK